MALRPLEPETSQSLIDNVLKPRRNPLSTQVSPCFVFPAFPQEITHFHRPFGHAFHTTFSTASGERLSRTREMFIVGRQTLLYPPSATWTICFLPGANR
jgi:hypothetical protein